MMRKKKEQETITLTVEELQLLLEAMKDEEFFLSIPLALERSLTERLWRALLPDMI